LPATSRSPTSTTASFHPSRWIAFRPSPAQPTATKHAFCTCPTCATTCSISRWFFAGPLGHGSSLDYLGRSEPGFHARNVGRFDSTASFPSFFCRRLEHYSEVAFRDTFYSGSQYPDLTGARAGTPTISHNALNRSDLEAVVDIRPPALERDFEILGGSRELRHVIEPELTYRYVGGIGTQARNVLLVIQPTLPQTPTKLACPYAALLSAVRRRSIVRCGCRQHCNLGGCAAKPREWASWQIAQKFYLDPNFGGAILPNRRNVFDSTLDLTGVAFLTGRAIFRRSSRACVSRPLTTCAWSGTWTSIPRPAALLQTMFSRI